MARGRKTKPGNIKVIQGTFRDDRANPNAPDPSGEIPRSPSWLPPEAREYFGILKERLDTYGLASKTHTEMLAMAAQRLAEIDLLNQIILQEGNTYKQYVINKEGESLVNMIKGHPAVGQRNEAMRHLQSLLSEFGLSPASVGKVSIKDNKRQKSGWEGFGT
jgi:P27 family predicted phage terminase small subunit